SRSRTPISSDTTRVSGPVATSRSRMAAPRCGARAVASVLLPVAGGPVTRTALGRVTIGLLRRGAIPLPLARSSFPSWPGLRGRRGQLAGPSRNQPDRENGAAAYLGAGVPDALEKPFGGDPPEPGWVLIQDRHRGAEGHRHRDVTESDH